MMPEPMRLVVAVSGNGTTLQNLIDRIAAGRLCARIVGVISSRGDAFGVQRAQTAGLPVVVLRRRDFPTLQAFSDAFFAQCRQWHAELVCLAGFLQKLQIPPDFVQRVLNIHPSLLPAFGGQGMYGHFVHEAVLRTGVSETGCTVHWVDDEYDHGPILLQKRVPVLPDDTPERLAHRVFRAECEAYPEAIEWVIQQHRQQGTPTPFSGPTQGS